MVLLSWNIYFSLISASVLMRRSTTQLNLTRFNKKGFFNWRIKSSQILVFWFDADFDWEAQFGTVKFVDYNGAVWLMDLIESYIGFGFDAVDHDGA